MSLDHSYMSTPPAGVLFHRSPLAKIGLAMVILAIIGLIISFFVPWVYVSWGSNSITLDHNLKDKDGKLFGTEFGYHYEDAVSALEYILCAPSMADSGFVFLIILGVIAMVLGMIRVSYNRLHHLFSISAVVIGAIGIIPSLWILISGARFIGFNVYSIFKLSTISNLPGFYYPNALEVYPAAYILFIFGIIFMVISSKIIKKESRFLNKENQTPPEVSDKYQMSQGVDISE